MDREQGFVVVVDDDHRIREALENLLESVGYAVRAFPSAEAFLDSQMLRISTCVISDVGMSGMSGIALRDHLKSIDPDLPVILITADPETMCMQQLENRESPFCFKKPFDGRKLIAAVAVVSRCACVRDDPPRVRPYRDLHRGSFVSLPRRATD